MFGTAQRKKARMRVDIIDAMSARTYNLIIGGCLAYGFALNALIVWAFGSFFEQMNPALFLVGYIVSCLLGTLITRSNNPVASFVGYNLVVVPIGAVLSVVLPGYHTAEILAAIVVTGIVVVVMTGLSSVYEGLFAGMGRALFVGLTVGFLAQFVAMLFGYAGQIFNWFFVVLFSLYLGYDWHRAQQYPKTLNNAIDSALDIYLDIINLFLRLLQIIGRRND